MLLCFVTMLQNTTCRVWQKRQPTSKPKPDGRHVRVCKNSRDCNLNWNQNSLTHTLYLMRYHLYFLDTNSSTIHSASKSPCSSAAEQKHSVTLWSRPAAAQQSKGMVRFFESYTKVPRDRPTA
eukprot:882613-Pelagomonas_calceolata.AAC.3